MSDTDIVCSVDAGLPNITGTLGSMTGRMASMSGAFEAGGNFTLQKNGSTNGSQNCASLNASKSSAIYGKSSTVTPLSMSTFYFIKF